MPTYDRPFRLRVLDALTDRLKTITASNGYSHDLSNAVFRGRLVYGDNEPLPMVSILEPPVAPDTKAPDFSGAAQASWDLLLQGWVEDDHKNPTDPAYVLAADVAALLAAERKQRNNILGFGNKVYDLKIGSPVVRPSDDISAKAYFWIQLRIEMAEDVEKPYDW